MTLFEQPPQRSRRPAEEEPFASLARSRRRRRTLVVSGVVTVVLLVSTVAVFGSGADRALVAQVGEWMGPRALAADISAVADHAFLTGEGRELLTLVGATSARGRELQRSCGVTDTADDHAVAGCYGLAGILVFVPTDPRVADAAVTTLAHELLHAAFDRLGSGEVWHVRDLLHDAIDRVDADDPVRQQIDWSVGDHEENRDTELFAYLGSQVWPEGGFAPELEAVYARYFTDRAALVEVHDRVTAAVDGLISDYERADAELRQAVTDAATRRAQLDADREVYERDRLLYQQDADRYNSLAPADRAQWGQDWTGADGVRRSGTWQEALAGRLADLDARHADLDSRVATVEAADADAAARRAAIDGQYADVLAVTKALDPASAGS
ncbi:hypothetical protein [Microbacterium sp. RURRCA19A]|uniref:hypothetical protein n=1 Tax=Microbacterium sp. RURRCA19A TaxID=1907391 RepID=UPI0009542716|nr:hypothetical protein [Microbacterium sp. RURRCA19A]SIS02510.1 hypothetical protein SAMN05880568_2479 [Microbacterium sp. RURRCA19A]